MLPRCELEREFYEIIESFLVAALIEVTEIGFLLNIKKSGCIFYQPSALKAESVRNADLLFAPPPATIASILRINSLGKVTAAFTVPRAFCKMNC